MQNLIAVLYVYDDGTTEHTSATTFVSAAKAIYDRCSTKNVVSALGITIINNKSRLFEFNSDHVQKLKWTEEMILENLTKYWWPFL
jgi:hypothetical protein